MAPKADEELPITDLFDQLIEASTLRSVLTIYQRILKCADLQPCEFNVFFPKLKKAIMASGPKGNWKSKALLTKIQVKASHKCYSNPKAISSPLGTRASDNSSRECLDDRKSPQPNKTPHNNNALKHHNCLVIGSGPAGLRTAIELQLLGGSRVVVVEKRTRFSRNNVLHLWPFVIDDLKSLGAKKFYGKFCAGSIDHISIRQLQLILLKVCLMIGCEFKENCSYLYLCPSSMKHEPMNRTDEQVPGFQAPDNSNNLKCDLERSDVNESPANSRSNQNNTPEGIEIESTKQPREQIDAVNIVSDSIDRKSDIHQDNDAANKKYNQRDKLYGARAHFQCEDEALSEELHNIDWDVIIGADGRRNSWNKLFERKELRGKLAIAITANFVNHRTDVENSIPEIPGLSYMYYQDKFNALAFETGIQLENICYYKDDTHYFVMTAKKSSLLCRGVLKNDCANAQDLLSINNVDRDALLNYAVDAASWTTGMEPPLLEFASNHHGEEDCAMFDFTSMYAASNACRALRTRGGGLCLIGLVGDSLLEPFWPIGSGCARGFLSAFDAAWMCRQWSVNRCAFIENHRLSSSRQGRSKISASKDREKQTQPVTYDKMALNVLAERESIYRILNHTTSESLQPNYMDWELNPHTRYKQLNRQFVTPSQVTYLLGNGTKPDASLSPRIKTRVGLTLDRTRRVKSPNNNLISRKSPKKLKSADASPVAQLRNLKNRSKSLTKYAYSDRDTSGFEIDETYLGFEDSYRHLTGGRNIPSRRLTYGRQESDTLIPFTSGTSPSSNNLLNLEAGRVRELDECLRQRRQTKKINLVCKELVEQFRNNAPGRDKQYSNRDLRRDSTIFQEIRCEREKLFAGKENNRPMSISNPLTLFNNVNRSASFAARLQTFEHRPKSFCEQDSTATARKTPIDNVKNLPQFATLQELFVNNAASTKGEKKPHGPVMKISKNDWNFKCWEERLAAEKRGHARGFTGSTRSLNKATSVDSYQERNFMAPSIKDEVFKDRVKAMAGKLRISIDDESEKLHGMYQQREENTKKDDKKFSNPVGNKYNNRPQGEWVKHLKRELIKSSPVIKMNPFNFKQPPNPNLPSKPIKKLFEEDEDDGKHYDHLCLNRPTTKQLVKNGYTSHLVRTKYDSKSSKVVNTRPTTVTKPAYVAGLTSRGSSASSTLSDYSTNTGYSSSNSMSQNNNEDVKCFRCDKMINSVEKITIGHANLHLNCLLCAQCGITLRMDELHYYLKLFDGLSESLLDKCYVCSICKPDMKVCMANRSTVSNLQPQDNRSDCTTKTHAKSREEFLNAPIDYNLVYKNLLDDDKANRVEVCEIIGHLGSSSSGTVPQVNQSSSGHKSLSSQDDYEGALSKVYDDAALQPQDHSRLSPALKVTLPMKLVVDCQAGRPHEGLGIEDLNEDARIDRGESSTGYRIARSETVDGSEQVTLLLPDDSTYSSVTTVNERASFTSKSHEMIDEDEFERRLRSGNVSLILQRDDDSSNDNRKEKLAAIASGSSTPSSSIAEASKSLGRPTPSNEEGAAEKSGIFEDTSDENDVDDKKATGASSTDSSENSSSLNSPSIDEYDDESNGHVDSTYEDFATSKEFDLTSDRDDAEDDQEDIASDEEEAAKRANEVASSDQQATTDSCVNKTQTTESANIDHQAVGTSVSG